MGHITVASEEQQRSVADMVDGMRKSGISYTLGWDVVVSYSEAHINKLLEKRWEKKATTMLKDIELTYVDTNEQTEEDYNVDCLLKFGPPNLQFNAKATEPSCSMVIPLLGGTTKAAGGKGPKAIPEGIKMVIKNIPLDTVRGRIVEGTIQPTSSVQPGAKPLQFESGSTEQAHIVLNFDKIEHVDFEHPAALERMPLPFRNGKFRDGVVEYIKNPKYVSGLSYSIAAVSNDTPSSGFTVLRPEVFMFAAFIDNPDSQHGPLTSISIFIKTQGGKDSGTRDHLQAAWTTQWSQAKLNPIPDKFTASLLFSNEYTYDILLAPALKQPNWSCKQRDHPNGISLIATQLDDWYMESSSQHTGWNTTTRIFSKSFSVKEFPLYVDFFQPDGRSSPKIYMKWEVEGKTTFDTEMETPSLLLGSGSLSAKWRMAEKGSYRAIDTKLTCSDTEFKVEIDPNTIGWFCDISVDSDTVIDIPPQPSELGYLRSAANKTPKLPTMTFPGINFFRTTNLLTPGEECIDFNEGIGMKLPKDLLLVGEVLPI